MLFRYTLLLCVALAVAMPQPRPAKASSTGGTTGATTKSEISHTAYADGKASVSTASGAQGNAAAKSKDTGPGYKDKQDVATSTHVSGSGAAGGGGKGKKSTGGGYSQQTAGAKAAAGANEDGTGTGTTTYGQGSTGGHAAAVQEAGATAEGNTKLVIRLPGGKKGVKLVDSIKGESKSGSSHEASSEYEGEFTTHTGSVNAVKLDGVGPDVDVGVTSKLGQTGQTHDSGSTNARSYAEGSGDSKAKISAGKKLTQKSQGDASAAGYIEGGATGDSAYNQQAKAKSDVSVNKDGTTTSSGNYGSGHSTNGAGIIQSTHADASGERKDAIKIKVGGKKKRIVIKNSGENSGESESNSEAYSDGKGGFEFTNFGGSDVRQNVLKPGIDATITTGQEQTGKTYKGGSVSSDGSSLGEASEKFVLKGKRKKLTVKKNGYGSAGTSADSQAEGNSSYGQIGTAIADIKSTKDGVQVAVGSGGKGGTTGHSTINQGAGAVGHVDRKKKITVKVPNGKKKPIKIKQSEEQSADAGTGHGAHGSNDSSFYVETGGKTTSNNEDIKVDPKKGH